jgi:peroxin-1
LLYFFQVSLASDASLEDVASLTEGFTGADLAAILTDAGLAAVHELLDNRENGVPESEPCISKELLMSVARKARPSTPADEKRRYDREFGEFVSSRKSVSTKVHLISSFTMFVTTDSYIGEKTRCFL